MTRSIGSLGWKDQMTGSIPLEYNTLMGRAVKYVMVPGWSYRNDFTIWEKCECGTRLGIQFLKIGLESKLR